MAEAGLSSFNPPGQPPSTPWSEVIGNAFNRWMDQRQAEILEANKNTNPRSVAGDVISTAMNILPAGPRMAVPRSQGIRAYHGSPYDFDRFDLSKIGTGEGAQAYGHGLYFAENPSVAQSYKTTGMTSGQSFAAEMMRRTGGNREAAIAEMQKAVEANGNGTYGTDMYRQALDALQNKAPLGKMYEVNINAKPEQFLDWDRPLGAQGQSVQEIAQRLIPHRQGYTPELTGSEAYNVLARMHEPPVPPDPPGYPKGWAYPRRGNEGEPFATAVLRDAGVPGIRYLDQGSRGKEAGTSNYVLFNDKIVDILRKWGVIGPTVGAGAAAATQDQSQ